MKAIAKTVPILAAVLVLSASCEFLNQLFDVTAPDPVTGLTVEYSGHKTATLTWTQS